MIYRNKQPYIDLQILAKLKFKEAVMQYPYCINLELSDYASKAEYYINCFDFEIDQVVDLIQKYEHTLANM